MDNELLQERIDRFVSEFRNVINDLKKDPRQFMKQLSKEINPKFDYRYEKYFAKKEEIDPTKIELELKIVDNEELSTIFKNAVSMWSVPVSSGYGRRMRFILWDKTHDKVFGIFGLCDPVFGLKARDEYIGWDKRQKSERLYNIMTAYILGAVYPYNELYGSKMVALATGSKEVCKLFEEKYKGKKTVIKGRTPIPKLVAVDTMAFFGKSLIYEGLREWQFLGYTKGLMHAHLNRFWDEIVELARMLKVESIEKNRFGQGSNWKFRVLQDVFKKIGIREDFLSTDMTKGYYFRPLAENWREFLKGETDDVIYVNKTFDEYFQLWKEKYLRRRVSKFNREKQQLTK
jgi:hypothetical protein